MSKFIHDFQALRLKFPMLSAVGKGNEACDYSDNLFQSTNCYFCFESFDLHDCLYCEDHGASINQDVDCRFGIGGNRNCQSIDYANSSDCYNSQSFARCYNLWYCWYCVDCHDCFGCANLHNKSYCIHNVQYTKEEYEKALPELKKIPKEKVLKKREKIISQFPQLHSEHLDNVNSEYCDYAYFMRNCYYCFDCAHDEDCSYLVVSYESRDCWDCNYVIRGDQLLESSHCGDCYNCYKITDCDRCTDSYFLEDCSDCHDCFGCVKLSHKSYCILNFQYTREEYFAKVAELKKELDICFSSDS